MATTGTTTLDFSTGKTETSATVTGQASILANSRVSAWVEVTASADHTADEHRLEAIQVVAGAITAGVGFVIYGTSLTSPLTGTYTVGWAWV